MALPVELAGIVAHACDNPFALPVELVEIVARACDDPFAFLGTCRLYWAETTRFTANVPAANVPDPWIMLVHACYRLDLAGVRQWAKSAIALALRENPATVTSLIVRLVRMRVHRYAYAQVACTVVEYGLVPNPHWIWRHMAVLCRCGCLEFLEWYRTRMNVAAPNEDDLKGELRVLCLSQNANAIAWYVNRFQISIHDFTQAAFRAALLGATISWTMHRFMYETDACDALAENPMPPVTLDAIRTLARDAFFIRPAGQICETFLWAVCRAGHAHILEWTIRTHPRLVRRTVTRRVGRPNQPFGVDIFELAITSLRFNVARVLIAHYPAVVQEHHTVEWVQRKVLEFFEKTVFRPPVVPDNAATQVVYDNGDWIKSTFRN
jgi:hypothetical protein